MSTASPSHTPFSLNFPLLTPLLLPNTGSSARDHCANERTFLSWLRLSIYMAVVSIAIVISFHLQHTPTPLEKQLALPFGLVFWVLSLVCLGNGVANYVRTVGQYAQRRAMVQAGWKSTIVVALVAFAIVGACILFISTDAISRRS